MNENMHRMEEQQLKIKETCCVLKCESTSSMQRWMNVKSRLSRPRPGGAAGGHEEEGVGGSSRQHLEPLRAQPQPPPGEGRHRDRGRRRGGLVHRLLAEAEGEDAGSGEGAGGGEGPDGEEPAFKYLPSHFILIHSTSKIMIQTFDPLTLNSKFI